MEHQLQEVRPIVDNKYYIHNDSVYNGRVYLDVQFQDVTLSSARRATNRSTASVRVTVEWIYKEVKIYWTALYFKRKLKTREGVVGCL